MSELDWGHSIFFYDDVDILTKLLVVHLATTASLTVSMGRLASIFSVSSSPLMKPPSQPRSNTSNASFSSCSWSKPFCSGSGAGSGSG